jgi:hypothetical protein
LFDEIARLGRLLGVIAQQEYLAVDIFDLADFSPGARCPSDHKSSENYGEPFRKIHDQHLTCWLERPMELPRWDCSKIRASASTGTGSPH